MTRPSAAGECADVPARLHTESREVKRARTIQRKPAKALDDLLLRLKIAVATKHHVVNCKASETIAMVKQKLTKEMQMPRSVSNQSCVKSKWVLTRKLDKEVNEPSAEVSQSRMLSDWSAGV